MPHLPAEHVHTVTQGDRDKLKPFLNPKWGTPAAGTTDTPFLFVKCQKTASGNPAIRSSIVALGVEVKSPGQPSLHAALLHSLKVAIPDAGAGFVPRASGFEGFRG